MALSIRDLKAYVPAKDFELSKRFYSALGFKMSEGWGGTADFELNGNRFRLQNYYVKDWAENFMMVMGVDDVEAWYQHARKIAETDGFKNVCISPPEKVDDSRVLHLRTGRWSYRRQRQHRAGQLRGHPGRRNGRARQCPIRHQLQYARKQ
jgi:hypothetical protein